MNKKPFILVAVALLSSSITGCSNFTVPEFEKSDGFKLVAYAGPTVPAFGNVSTQTDEHFKKVAEAGFTHILALYDGVSPTVPNDKIENLVSRAKQAEKDALGALDLCQKYNLKYYVRDWNLYGMSRVGEMTYTQGIKDYESYKWAMNYIFSDECQYVHHPSYAGNYIFDEPLYDEIFGMGDVVKAYEERMTELGVTNYDPYVNLLPGYANPTGLGAKGYDGYLDRYINQCGNKVGYISYDSYPFMQDKAGSYIKMLYLYNLYTVAQKCKETNLDMRTYVQTKGDFTGLRDMTSTADFRWQVYNDLAFGSRYITFYEYGAKTSAVEGEFGPLNLMDGTYNWTYNCIKTVNNEIKNFEDAFAAYKWDNIMYKNADELYENPNFSNIPEPLEKHDEVSFVNVEQDTLLTTFKHKNNDSSAFMLLNYSDPYFKKNDKVTLKFPKAKGLLMYRLGQKMIVNLPSNGQYTCVLGPGEGRFIIPLN